MAHSSDELDEFIQIYLEESEEEAEQLIELLLRLEQDPKDHNSLREAFRLLHTFKGSSGMMGFERINGLAHELETRFDAYRDGREQLTTETVSVTLRCIDFFRSFLGRLRAGSMDQGDPRPLIEELIEIAASSTSSAPTSVSGMTKADPIETMRRPTEVAVQQSFAAPDDAALDAALDEAINEAAEAAISRHERASESKVNAATPTRVQNLPPIKPPSEGPRRLVVLCARLSEATELPELKARLMVAKLQSHGEIENIAPPLDQVDDTPPPMTIRISLRTTHSDDRLTEALSIEGVDAVYFEEAKEAIPSPSPETKPRPTSDSKGSGGTAVATGLATSQPGKSNVETIRIGIDRLDRLMNLAGELAVTNARFAQLADEMRLLFRAGGSIDAGSPLAESILQILSRGSTSTGLVFGGDGVDEEQAYRRGWMERGRRVASQVGETVDQLARLSRSLQHAVLETRMVPVGPLFTRFRRIVRDLSLKQGKQVRLELEGENTELDKRMVDELGDPMVHLIRNALDHGIESPAKRSATGKPEEGVIRLRAFHQSNNVVIEISDDGNGIDAAKIRTRAAERGLATVAALSQMSDTEVYSFIWRPGFSTAETVSDISGRGVGMDVVKERIAALGGAVELDSRPGRGSTMTLRLPLTLAIVNSLIVRFRGFRFAIPVTDVSEVIGLSRSELFDAQGKPMLDLRGHLVPLYCLDQLFNWNDALPTDTVEKQPEDWLQAVLVRDGHRTVAIEVDDLDGNSDVVIKSLDEHFAHIPGLSGACVMGDGSVCLVIDTASLSICRSSFRTAPELNNKHNQPANSNPGEDLFPSSS
jgi:two-component system chemotaxis sensor kinase CheA